MESQLVLLLIVGIIVVLGIILIYLTAASCKHKIKTTDLHQKANKYRCLDGHRVRSKGELIIDNYLFFLGISHTYEKVIFLRGNKLKCDWFLPECDVYIEYWGYSGNRYLKRKKQKLNLYKKEKKKLVSIENWMFYDIYTNINKLLEKYLKINKEKYWKPKPTKKFCSNCGIELDERF